MGDYLPSQGVDTGDGETLEAGYFFLPGLHKSDSFIN
jgi:hypothetical protein